MDKSYSTKNSTVYVKNNGKEEERPVMERECNKVCNAFFSATDDIAQRNRQTVFKTFVAPTRIMTKEKDGSYSVSYVQTSNSARFECCCHIVE